jgi:hypothetical protein
MNLRLLIAAVASVAVVGTASAQYPGYSYGYTNPYNGFTSVSNYNYNPYSGTFGGYSASYNPWTGYGTKNYSYNNLYGGFARGYSAYNAYSGYYYGTRAGYNPWTGGVYNSYRVNPGYGYGYWR